MALTRDFKDTVVRRVQNDPAFALALYDEAASLFFQGESEAARLILRDLVNATIGFNRIAQLVQIQDKSVQRMLSKDGNPTMNNLSTIFGVLRQELNISKLEITVQ